MKASMFVFGTDLVDEGLDTVLSNLSERAGVGAVSLSATYHDARDVFAHNPRRKVYRHEGDVAWFRPDAASYPPGLAPPLAAEAEGRDLLAELCDRAGERGVEVNAWTIFGHNSRVGMADPTCTTQNVYGDRIYGDLCPANPRVQDYFLALAADVCRYPVTRLLAECLHYRPFEHGDHHERYFLDLPGPARALLGLCFCVHCRAGATAAGVNAEKLARGVRRALEPLWLGDPQRELPQEVHEQLPGYLDFRESVVTSLAARVRDVANNRGVALTFIDHAGAMGHVMRDTRPEDPVLLSSRRLGVNPAAVASVVDELSVLGYAASPGAVGRIVADYRSALEDGASVSCAVRPLPPDCLDAENLAQKVALVKGAGADRVDFYHYALAPLDRLDWVAGACRRADL